MKKLILMTGIILLSSRFASAKDLTDYQTLYKQKMEAINLYYDSKSTDLGKQYSKDLHLLLENVKKSGDLLKTKSVIAEIERFEKENMIPEKGSDLEEIKNLQGSFRKKESDIKTLKAGKIISLTSALDKALEKLQKTLVMSDKLKDAEKVLAERKRIKEGDIYKESLTLVSDSPSNSKAEPDVKPPKKKYLPYSLKEGLVLYFDFDKKETEKVIDKSKKKNNGILKGPTWTKEGKNGGAYHFEKKQIIIVEKSPSLNPTKEITISVWVNPDVIGSHRRILQKGDTDKQYMLTGNCRFILYRVGTSSSQVLRAKTWNHIVATYDGSFMKLFADGKKINEVKASGKIPAGGYNLHIGSKKDKGAFIDNFIGFIDEVMIYNKALSEEEVKKLYDIQK